MLLVGILGLDAAAGVGAQANFLLASGREVCALRYSGGKDVLKLVGRAVYVDAQLREIRLSINDDTGVLDAIAVYEADSIANLPPIAASLLDPLATSVVIGALEAAARSNEHAA